MCGKLIVARGLCRAFLLAIFLIIPFTPAAEASGWDTFKKLSQREITLLQSVFRGDEAKAVEFVQVAGIDVNAIAGEPLSAWYYRLGAITPGPSHYRDAAVQRIVFERFRQNPNPPNVGDTELNTFCNFAPFKADVRTSMFGAPEARRAQIAEIAAQQKPHIEAMAAGFASIQRYGLRDKRLINEIFRGCFFNNAAPVADTFVYTAVLSPMLRAGADINQPNFQGRRPIEIAFDGLSAELIQNLVRDGAQVNFAVLRSGTDRPNPAEPCAPQRYRSLYGYVFNWTKPKDVEPVLKIISTLASAGLSPMTKYGVMDNRGSGQCHYSSFYDAVIDTGNLEFAKSIKAVADGVRPSSITARVSADSATPQAPTVPPSALPASAPLSFGDWQTNSRSDGRAFATVPATSLTRGKGLKELQIECTVNGGLEFVLVPYGNEMLATIIPDEVDPSQEATRPFAAVNNRIGAPENVRLMKRLLAEESNARQSGAGDSWTFAFYVNDATAAGYSANMGGLSKVRQHLLKQCLAASQGRQAGAPTPPN